ncbi:M6 family metalloprotease domain-containing protein [Streptomyces albireticuli]|uniref:Peptidase M6 n=1 Tax=Streptomyces albireticuli TaxID=1940 RepID=A0A2A2D1F2_9ACTN|nr:M6 family metalloprotease domain-containing protein [Streptomyces albireticuli]MCD9145881.1 M6 family metalloprotease domain-containing protein [Streptomyces albireticuli]MCD9166132.1 M6 family metalloprotease domain-containing protein [Streptomyces albireticuli]MCD9189634.1 M6 family metalloprotease domain-containing protein [Streptomyces albireticuli]PAU45344.1 peptidase M6 [Streptomyces albireticuli]
MNALRSRMSLYVQSILLFMFLGNFGTDAWALSSNPSDCRLSLGRAYLSEGLGGRPDFTPSSGSVKAAMIFVDFPDAPANDTTDSLSSKLIPGAQSWYKDSSYGSLNLEVEADGGHFYRMPRKSVEYGYGRGLSYEVHRQYVQDAVNAAGKSAALKGAKILYIVPTSSAKEISFSPTFMGEITTADGSKIPKTVTFGQDIDYWGYKVLNHETGHAMGLPDLYERQSGGSGHDFVGGWDLMGLISGPSPDLLGWHKWKLNWIKDDQVGCLNKGDSGEQILSPIEVPGGQKISVIKLSESQAIVAEVRTSKGLNNASCSSGVLIYKVDTEVNTGAGPIRIFDARPNSGGCGGHELNDATFGDRRKPISRFKESGVTIDVRAEGEKYALTVGR